MKPFILITAIFIVKFSLSQTMKDTLISKSKLDSLETTIYQLTDSLKRAQYKNIFFENYISADSVLYGKDSIIINYRAGDGKLIKRHTKLFLDSTDLLAYEKIVFYNNLQFPEFVELWETSRWEFKEAMFVRKIYSYERFAYDSVGKMTIWLKFYPAVSRNTIRRIEYHYTSDGRQTSTMSRVKIEKFWD